MTITDSYLADDSNDEASSQKVQSLDRKLEHIMSQEISVVPETEEYQDSSIEGSLPLRRKGYCGCFVRLSQKWPRLFAIIFKVIIPLLSLIGLSMLFGHWLAQLEGNNIPY